MAFVAYHDIGWREVGHTRPDAALYYGIARTNLYHPARIIRLPSHDDAVIYTTFTQLV